MNKNFLVPVLRPLAVLLIPFSLYSQSAPIDSTVNGAQSQLAVASFKKPVTTSNDNPVTWNLVNTRAIRDFRRTFKNVDNEQWIEMSKVFVAVFLNSDIKHRVVYDKKGCWLYTIKYYAEKQMPRDIRAIVKSTYYDYTINQIEEVHQEENIIYVVHLEDEKGWINVTVCNGQMGILQKIKK